MRIIIYYILTIFSCCGYSTQAADANNPEVIQILNVRGRSWIDVNTIYSDWGSVGPYNPPAYAAWLLGTTADTAIKTDTAGPDKDKLYRLWSYCDFEAKLKNNVLTVRVLNTDKDGGPELYGALSGTFNLNPPTLNQSGNEYTFDNMFCWGHPDDLLEPAFQLVRPRTSVNIWHRIKGRIYAEGGSIKYEFSFHSVSSYPNHALYVNKVEVERKNNGPISDLWKPSPLGAEYVIGK